jgi:two-component system CheB/CheR fusion protein
MSPKNPPAVKPVHPSPVATVPPVNTPAEDTFPVVALGASAGGLEALEKFFKSMAGDSGMAFVVIQHLDPDRKALMPALIQRDTAMKVQEAKDGARVRPNEVYILPPNKEMSVLHGVLHLFEPSAARGMRFPIDTFFHSLAQDRGHAAIGVILSGMGTDGTHGLREIRAHGGMTLAQDPGTAKYDSMPRSAIEAGLVDLVRPVEELPDALNAFLKHPVLRPSPSFPPDPGIEKALVLLRDHTGHDFSSYKINTVRRRIERRMNIHHLDTLEAYVSLLRENPGEMDLLFKELLIGVTRFFRDPEIWERLKEDLSAEPTTRTESGTFRIWVAGCSTGEEAYTLAMVATEALEALDGARRAVLRIFASDLSVDAIRHARRGHYLENIAADVSPERLERFFRREEDGSYTVRSEIRERIVFSVHSLITDPPFTRMDVVCCRNVLIYLSPEAQHKIISLFHYSLTPGGLLLLGGAESLGTQEHLLATVDARSRMFRKPMAGFVPGLVDFPTGRSRVPFPEASDTCRRDPMRQNLQTLAENLILNRFSPATVLVDELGNILHVSGRTGRYLEPAAGKANWNLFAMAREEIRPQLDRCFTKAMAEPGLALMSGLSVEEDGSRQYLDLGVERLTGPEPLAGMLLVLFRRVTPATVPTPVSPGSHGDSAHSAEREDLERVLEAAREELRIYREEMRRYREELRGANEELQSTNEELQSSNEELTSSKEEMNSLNEELLTVNAELQRKLDERSPESPPRSPQAPS